MCQNQFHKFFSCNLVHKYINKNILVSIALAKHVLFGVTYFPPKCNKILFKSSINRTLHYYNCLSCLEINLIFWWSNFKLTLSPDSVQKNKGTRILGWSTSTTLMPAPISMLWYSLGIAHCSLCLFLKPVDSESIVRNKW